MHETDGAQRTKASPANVSDVSSPSLTSAQSVRDALSALAPHAPDAQPKFGILHRVCGDENTHYMGQGASLR